MPTRCPQCGGPFPPRTPLAFLEADLDAVSPATDTPAVRCNHCGAWWTAELLGGVFFDYEDLPVPSDVADADEEEEDAE